MAYDFVTTHAFEKDYDNELARLTYEFHSPQDASALMDAMDESIAKISGNPFANGVSDQPSFKEFDYREECVGNYRMLYAIENYTVVAKRFLPASQTTLS